jgi:hypothetical protein
MSKKIKINGKFYQVNNDEYNKVHHEEYSNLNILDQLGFHERQISLIKEISKIYPKKINIRMNYVSHGGFIPIMCSDNFLNIYISYMNDIKSHSDNILVNIVNHLSHKNIYSYNFYNEIVNNKYFYEFDFEHPETSIIISLQPIINPLNYKTYQLTNLSTKWTPQQTLYINVPQIIDDIFVEKFKYYFNEKGDLDYDNLIHMCVMVKNGGPQFESTLKKNIPIIDRWTILDTGSTDNTIETIHNTLVGVKKGELYEEPFINFKDSRNRCLDLAGKECKYIIMLDDTYVVEGNLRDFLNIVRGDQYSTSFTIFIKSDDTEYGSNRIIKSDSGLRYIFKIHEVITDKDNINVVIPIKSSRIIDGRYDYMEERTKNRKQLDLKLLYEEVEDDPNNPRTYYYLAQTYNQLEDYEKAFYYFMKRCEFVNSGFIQERFDAAFEAARIANFKLNKAWEECLNLYEKAYKIDESRPECLYFIGINYYLKGNNTDAYKYLKKGYEVGYPTHCQYSLKPTLSFHYLPKFLTRICYQPSIEDFKLGEEVSRFFLLHNNENSEDYEEILSWYKIYQKLNSVDLNNLKEKMKYDKPLFLFVADGGFKKWNGSSILKEGVGGSETYIIEMSKYIQKNGVFQVIVFCNCENEEVFDDVYYKDISKYPSFIYENNIHTSIISRYSEYLPLSYRGNIDNIYLVLHDLTPSGNVIPLEPKLKKIFCLTEWHVSYFTNIFPQLKHLTEPFYYGIDIEKFGNINNINNKIPYKFIYSSFPNRGLLPLLEMWPHIWNKENKASLHIYSDINGEWVNSVAFDQMKEIRKLLDEYKGKYNIFYYGWVDKKTLSNSWKTADFWFYPCIFKETFCLTALEAALSKTFVITNGLAALENTVGDRGITVNGNIQEVMTEKWKEEALNKIFYYMDQTNNKEKEEFIIKNYEWALSLTWENQANKLLKEHILYSYPNKNIQNKNCIFLTLFMNKEYIKLLELFLHSLYLYGNVNKSTTDILIYTSSEFKDIIKNIFWYKYFNIKIVINDLKNTKVDACKARFDIFKILNINEYNYNNILYLDTDIIINGDINKIFDICQDDKLYAVFENHFTIDHPLYGNNWGFRLFSKEELLNIKDKRSINSGSFLFKNAPNVRKIFNLILEDKRNSDDSIYDQEFINYHFIINKLVDKDILTKYMRFIESNNLASDLYYNKCILHFYVQGIDNKISLMSSFLEKRIEKYFHEIVYKVKSEITENLLPIIKQINEPLEGCLFSEHLSNKITDFGLENAINISNILHNINNQNIINILEIGFNAGFSSLLMLYSNPNVHITCVDICDHKYTIPCYNWIYEKFKNRITFIKGNSEEVLPDLVNKNKKYDLIHIDGGHSYKTFFHDVQNSIKLLNKESLVIIDDYDFQYINFIWNLFVDYYKMIKISLYKETNKQSIYQFKNK